MFVVDPRSDIRRDLDHALHLVVLVQHRHVAGFQPHFLAVLVQAHEGAAKGLAPRQVAPQLGVGVGVGVGLVAKEAVMFTADLLGAVAHGVAEVVVGVEDHTTGVELDHGHGTADGRQFGVGFGKGAGETFDLLQVGFVMAVEHGQITLGSRRLEAHSIHLLDSAGTPSWGNNHPNRFICQASSTVLGEHRQSLALCKATNQPPLLTTRWQRPKGDGSASRPRQTHGAAAPSVA